MRSLAAIGLALLAGCASWGGSSALPPVTAEAGDRALPGKWVWFDLVTEDASEAERFYGELFGWSFDGAGAPRGYRVIRNGDTAIGGVAEIADELPEPQAFWVGWLSVEDVDAAAERVRAQGGEVVDAPLDDGRRGRMSYVRDAQGAELVLLRSRTGDPPDANPGIHDWLWVDLITSDGTAAGEFYAQLVGYASRDVERGPEHVYRVVGRDGRARAGIVEVAWEDVEPNWLPYVRVSDVGETVRVAESLGGTLLLRVNDAAILTDPTGAAFGVQRIRLGRES